MIYYEELAKKLKMSVEELKENSKKLKENNVTYFWQTFRGGLRVLVDEENYSYLEFNSSINFDYALNDFKNGKRSGKFN